MKNTVSRDRIPPQIFGAHDRIQNYDIVQRITNNQIIYTKNGQKINYQEDLTPPYFITQTEQVKLRLDIMTLLPYNNKNQSSHNVKNKIIRKNSTLLARLTMNALAASETEITAILELVETMYSSIQAMLQEVKQKQQMYKPPESKEQESMPEPQYVIKIDLNKFMKYLNERYIRSHSEIDPQNGSNQAIALQAPHWKQPSLTRLTNKCKSFNIILKPRRMCFSMSVCKFNSCSMDFFQRLATFYNSCNMTYNTTKRKHVPSVFIRDWHFKNVSQGYLLSALLKHNNVMSLNVMRKLYFVIITSVTPNLTIEINFKLANGIFMAYDTPPFEQFPLKVIHWNDRHRNVLESSSKILYMPVFTYSTPQRDDNLKYDIQRDTKSENTLHNKSSSDSSSTLKYESSSEYEGSDYFIRSTSYSTSGFLDLKSTESSTNLTLRESVKTLTISLDDMLSYHVLLNNRKDCGDMNFTNLFQEQYNSTIHHSRTWMSKVFRETSKLKSEVVMPYLNSVMNETVFDRVTVSLEDCGSAFTKYCTGFVSRTFCKVFVRDLGSYLVHALIFSILYH